MKTTLTRKDLYSLEHYNEIRDEFRQKVMAHKKNRRLEIGENILLLFEDKLIMKYQVQEMLRAEKIFDGAGIDEELDVYNPLIPDGSNWKATMLIQYTNTEQRQHQLQQLVGIENKVWMQVASFDKVFALADEDLERADEQKTSAVHFLRFQLTPAMVTAVKSGAEIAAGVDHEKHQHSVNAIDDNLRQSLAKDLG